MGPFTYPFEAAACRQEARVQRHERALARSMAEERRWFQLHERVEQTLAAQMVQAQRSALDRLDPGSRTTWLSGLVQTRQRLADIRRSQQEQARQSAQCRTELAAAQARQAALQQHRTSLAREHAAIDAAAEEHAADERWNLRGRLPGPDAAEEPW